MRKEGKQMKKRLCLTVTSALALALVVPGSAVAQGGVGAVKTELDVTWVMVATALVLFMQAGFLLLEIGFSRGKNVGAGVVKVLVNLGIVTIAWWAVGQGVNGL